METFDSTSSSMLFLLGNFPTKSSTVTGSDLWRSDPLWPESRTSPWDNYCVSKVLLLVRPTVLGLVLFGETRTLWLSVWIWEVCLLTFSEETPRTTWFLFYNMDLFGISIVVPSKRLICRVSVVGCSFGCRVFWVSTWVSKISRIRKDKILCTFYWLQMICSLLSEIRLSISCFVSLLWLNSYCLLSFLSPLFWRNYSSLSVVFCTYFNFILRVFFYPSLVLFSRKFLLLCYRL